MQLLKPGDNKIVVAEIKFALVLNISKAKLIQISLLELRLQKTTVKERYAQLLGNDLLI